MKKLNYSDSKEEYIHNYQEKMASSKSESILTRAVLNYVNEFFNSYTTSNRNSSMFPINEEYYTCLEKKDGSKLYECKEGFHSTTDKSVHYIHIPSHIVDKQSYLQSRWPTYTLMEPTSDLNSENTFS